MSDARSTMTMSDQDLIDLCRHLLDRGYRPNQAAVISSAYLVHGIGTALVLAENMDPPIGGDKLTEDFAAWERGEKQTT